MDYIKKAKKMARKHKMKMHLDGARSFNGAAFLGISPAEMCKDFDTVSVCLSKGLGAPLGSVVVGKEKDIKHCLILRKLLGGNLRQAGIICQAALHNLENWEESFNKDHDNCMWLAKELAALDMIELDTSLVETNMFRFKFKPESGLKHDEFANRMKEKHGILMTYGHKNEAIRLVTHRNIDKAMIEKTIKLFKKEIKL